MAQLLRFAALVGGFPLLAFALTCWLLGEDPFLAPPVGWSPAVVAATDLDAGRVAALP